MRDSRMGTLQYLFVLICGVLVCSGLKTHGMENDMNTFWLWADRLYSRGISEFYAPDYFADYPPGYLYVLWIIGWIGNLTGIVYNSTATYVLLKIPSILAFITLVTLVFRSLSQQGDSGEMPTRTFRTASVLVFCFFLTPALWHNVGWFGQVDVIAVLLGFLALKTLQQKKFLTSGLLFAALISTKPQGVFLGVGALGLLWTMRSELNIRRCAGLLGSFAATLLVFFLPFWIANAWSFSEHFVKMFSTYSYATVNAPNLFFVMGANWRPVAEPVWGIAPWVWFTLVVSLLSTLTYFSFHFSRRHLEEGEKSFQSRDALYLGFLAACSFFLFAPNMHERYFIVALAFAPFLLLRTKTMYFSLLIFSFAGFLAQQLVLDFFGDRKLPIEGPLVFASFYGFILSFVLAWWSWIFLEPRKNAKRQDVVWYCRGRNVVDAVSEFLKNPVPVSIPGRGWSLRSMDWILLTCVTLASLFLMFYQLGETKRPSTASVVEGDKSFTVELENPASKVKIYALSGSGALVVTCRSDEVRNTENKTLAETPPPSTMAIDHVSVLGWKEFVLAKPCLNVNFKMEKSGERVDIASLVFTDAEFARVQAVKVCDDIARNCVEGSIHPWTDENESYLNLPERMTGTIFDEIYYARSAMELLQGKTPYENTHPALSKVLMAFVAKAFGLAPFQWRTAGALAGALLPLLLFFFCYALGTSRSVAYITLFLSLLDHSRISIGRLATIDMLSAFWLVPVYLAVVLLIRRRVNRIYGHGEWVDLDFGDWSLYATIGLILGVNLALKWVALLTVGAVGVLLLSLVVYEWFTLQKANRGSFLLQSYGAAVLLLVLAGGVYYISFYPQYVFTGKSGSYQQMFLDAQKNMFSYHYNLVASHPFSSKVYSWPFLQKPLWLHVQNLKDSYMSVVVIGTPVFWYAATASILGIWWVRSLSQSWGLLLVFFIFVMQWLPWLGVNRIMYLYHYFPSACFLWIVLATLLSWGLTAGGLKRKAAIAIIFAGSLNFLMYLPVGMGLLTTRDYVAQYLQWFDGWFF